MPTRQRKSTTILGDHAHPPCHKSRSFHYSIERLQYSFKRLKKPVLSGNSVVTLVGFQMVSHTCQALHGVWLESSRMTLSPQKSMHERSSSLKVLRLWTWWKLQGGPTSAITTTMSEVDVPLPLPNASEIFRRLWMSSIVFLQLINLSKFSFTNAFNCPVRSLTSSFKFCLPLSRSASDVPCVKLQAVRKYFPEEYGSSNSGVKNRCHAITGHRLLNASSLFTSKLQIVEPVNVWTDRIAGCCVCPYSFFACPVEISQLGLTVEETNSRGSFSACMIWSWSEIIQNASFFSELQSALKYIIAIWNFWLRFTTRSTAFLLCIYNSVGVVDADRMNGAQKCVRVKFLAIGESLQFKRKIASLSKVAIHCLAQQVSLASLSHILSRSTIYGSIASTKQSTSSQSSNQGDKWGVLKLSCNWSYHNIMTAIVPLYSRRLATLAMAPISPAQSDIGFWCKRSNARYYKTADIQAMNSIIAKLAIAKLGYLC